MRRDPRTGRCRQVSQARVGVGRRRGQIAAHHLAGVVGPRAGNSTEFKAGVEKTLGVYFGEDVTALWNSGAYRKSREED